eukprot:TRINITY_DN5203_c0_g1_i1.p1 TRINITY_DN5203_c0_g1~~TRINITY_DN5203_c0_g1_i1.p1  ORF type:complete len:703 (-),score=179.41 TRINITY_DN5203_c0_g1_i1:69-2120(-)
MAALLSPEVIQELASQALYGSLDEPEGEGNLAESNYCEEEELEDEEEEEEVENCFNRRTTYAGVPSVANRGSPIPPPLVPSQRLLSASKAAAVASQPPPLMVARGGQAKAEASSPAERRAIKVPSEPGPFGLMRQVETFGPPVSLRNHEADVELQARLKSTAKADAAVASATPRSPSSPRPADAAVASATPRSPSSPRPEQVEPAAATTPRKMQQQSATEEAADNAANGNPQGAGGDVAATGTGVSTSSGKVKTKGASEKAQNFINRCEEWGKNREVRLAKLKAEEEKKQQKEIKASMRIGSISRRLVKDMQPVYERVGEIIQVREKARVKAKIQQEQKELEELPFNPAISQRAMRKERQLEDLERWKEKRDQRICEGQVIQQERELAGCTFRPQLSKGSESIASAKRSQSQVWNFRPGARARDGNAAESPSSSFRQKPNSTSVAPTANPQGSPLSFEDFVVKTAEKESKGRGAGSARPHSTGGATRRQTGQYADTQEVGGAINFETFFSSKVGARDDELLQAESPRQAAPKAQAAPSPRPVSPKSPKRTPRERQTPPALSSSMGLFESPSSKSLGADDHEAFSPVMAHSKGIANALKSSLHIKALETRERTPRAGSQQKTTPRAAKQGDAQAAQDKGQRGRTASTAQVPPSSRSRGVQKAAHIIPYCSEFEDVFQLTAQLCR